MNNWFFYQERGKIVGPLAVEDMRARIHEGRVRLFDLIYKEGEPGWRMALEHPDLRDHFKRNETADLVERPWVCLHRRSDVGFDFVTLGPFTTDEIREGIRAGKLSYGDYAWKSGFNEWKRIGGLEEFDRRAQARSENDVTETVSDFILPSIPRSPGQIEEAKAVVEMKRPALAKEMGPPPEARGDDLTKLEQPILPHLSQPPPLPSPRQQQQRQRDRLKPKLSEVISAVMPPAEKDPELRHGYDREEPADLDSPPANVSAAGQERATPKISIYEAPRAPGTSRKKGRWADFAIVGFLLAAMAGAGAYYSRGLRPAVKTDSPPPLTVAEDLEGGRTGNVELPPAGGQNGPTALPPVQEAAKSPPPSPPPSPTVNLNEPPINAKSDGGHDETDIHPTRANEPDSPTLPEKQSHANKPKLEKNKAPTELYIAVRAQIGGPPRIDVRSNGSPDIPIYVQVVGLPGQVAESGSFYRFLKVTSAGTINKPADLGKLSIPQGRYILRVETGNLKKEAPFSVGVGETQYKQSVAKARKANASALWHERLALFRVSENLQRALEKAMESKHLSARGFDALAAVKKSNGGRYLFYDDWWELKQIVLEARSGQVTQALVERARKVHDRMASFSVSHSR